MKIIIDAMGGDKAPDEIVRGAALARERLPGAEITLVGRGAEVRAALEKAGAKDMEIHEASETIDMSDEPVDAVRSKPDSSMVVGLKLLAGGGYDAMVSAGSTGALLAGATLIVKRVRGIRRAAYAPVLPSKSGKFIIIDAGANTECTPEYLLQFAYMGSYYAEGALGIAKPRVGLLNNGTEETKGLELQLGAYKLLKDAGGSGDINFIGNIEARDPMLGGCDVVVCDGFSGNILLKASEGAALFVMSEIKNVLMKNAVSKLAALLVKDGLSAIKARANPDTVGGTVLLGIAKTVVKAHGSSGAEAICSAISQAVTAAKARVSERLAESVSRMKGAE